MPRIALWIMTEIAIIGADIQEACTLPILMSWNVVKLHEAQP